MTTFTMDESTDLNNYENESMADNVGSLIELKDYVGCLFPISLNKFQGLFKVSESRDQPNDGSCNIEVPIKEEKLNDETGESKTMTYNSTKGIRDGTEETLHNSSLFCADFDEEQDSAELVEPLKNYFQESRSEEYSCLVEDPDDEDERFHDSIIYANMYDSDEEDVFEEANYFQESIPRGMWQDSLLSFGAIDVEKLLLHPEVSLTDFEQDSFYGRISERKPRRFRGYSPYCGRSSLFFSEDRESLHYKNKKVNKIKFIKNVVARSRQKLLKKTKISPQFLHHLSGLDKLKMPKSKHKTQRKKYILERIQENEFMYMRFKCALQNTGQKRLFNYLNSVEFEIAMSDDIDRYFVEQKMKRYRSFSRFYEDNYVEHMENQLKMREVLVELTVNKNSQDSHDDINKTLIRHLQSSNRFGTCPANFEMDCSRNENNRVRNQHVETQWEEEIYTDDKKLDNFGRKTKAFSSCLVEANLLGRGLSRSMKTLLVFALISCAAGENSFCSSSEVGATSWFFPYIQVFDRYKNCYEWQKLKVGACLPPERHIELQRLRAPIEMNSWQCQYAPFTISVAFRNRSFGHTNVQNTSSNIDFKQTMGHQCTFFRQIGKHSNDRNGFLKLINEKQVIKPCDHRNQSRVLEKEAHWKEVIKLSVVLKQVASLRTQQINNIEHNNTFWQHCFSKMQTESCLICSELFREFCWLKDKFRNVKQSSKGRVKRIRKLCRSFITPLDRWRLKTMNNKQILEMLSEITQTSDEQFNIHNMINYNSAAGIYPSICSGFKKCSSFLCDTLIRLIITVRAHEPIIGLKALTAINRLIPVHIQIHCEKNTRRHISAARTDYLIDNVNRLGTFLLHDVIENYTSLLKSPLSQEYCYNNRYHSITKTEKKNNRHNITVRPEYILKDKLLSYNSENSLLRTIIFVLICTSCVLVLVTYVTKVTVWFIYRPQVSNPALWLLCILYSAYTLDLIWLRGPPILFHIETENFEAKPKKGKLESENQGEQKIGKLLDPFVSIQEDYVPSKTKEEVFDDCSKDETLASSRENGENEEKVGEFRSLQRKYPITKADIERETKYVEHLKLVDLVYSTEKETTTYHEAITHDFEKVKAIHELSLLKAFNLSETEESIFEYYLSRENISTKQSETRNASTAFMDSENDIEFDGKKENIGQKITSIKVSTCVSDKGNKYNSGSAKAYHSNFRLHVIPNPSTDIVLKSDVISDVSTMYEKPILSDKLDLKSKSKKGKMQKKTKLDGIFKEAELASLASATREYTWLSLSELPVPKVNITVAFVPQFEPLLSIIDQIANGTPPTPHISMRYELLRFCTLRSYPKENKPYLIKLAEAGFYYASDGDGVVCYCCGVRRYNWVAEDNPMKIHERINPNCKFLRKNEEVNVPVKYFGPFSESLMAIMDIPEPRERSEQSEDVNNDWAPERIRSPASAQQNRQIETGTNSLGINTAIPKHTQYATKTAREASFNGWPDSASHTPQELADGGFFYAGFGDCVRCFFCGIGLRHWTKEDNPWIEHARWSRNCVFVKQKKGEEFVNLVQLAVQYSQDNDTQTSTGAENQLPAQEIERILLSDAAQSVLEMGYQPRIIKQAIEQSLQQNDSRKITAQILMEKVLEIEELESQTVVAHTEAAASALPVVKPASDTLKETGVNSSKPKTEKNDNKVQNGKTCAEDKTKQTDHAKNKLESTNETLDNDPKAIKAENEQLKEQTLCKVCLDNTVCIVFLPCGHLVTCADCAPAMRKCPICRALVKGTVRTYMS